MKLAGLIIFSVAHGYFAAWLAVWMLFYPRSPKKIFGFKVPFTPGLIPASRGKLEQAIAHAVATKLLLPTTLEDAAIKQGIPKMIRGTLPDHFEELADDPEMIETVSKAASEAVKEYIRNNQGLKSEVEEKDLVPYGKTFGITLDAILKKIWTHVEETVEKLCYSKRFRNTVQGAIRKLAADLKDDRTMISNKVEETAGKMVGSAVGALDIHTIIIDRLSSFSNQELEELVQQTAGHHLQSIKNVAALIGILFGMVAILFFG